MATQKLTIRLDPEVKAGFDRVCEINGASLTGLIQAWCEVMISETERHEGAALIEWDDYPEAAAWLYRRAQAIDYERRHKRWRETPPGDA